MAKPRAAILGAGLISGKKHIPAFLRLKHKVDLVLCDVNRGSGKSRDNFGIPHVMPISASCLPGKKPDQYLHAAAHARQARDRPSSRGPTY